MALFAVSLYSPKAAKPLAVLGLGTGALPVRSARQSPGAGGEAARVRGKKKNGEIMVGFARKEKLVVRTLGDGWKWKGNGTGGWIYNAV